MAIQIRRGNYADFDPNKMLPGEWAVSIDSDTEKQIVWMCFAAGVVKRMGTYEDFKQQIEEIAKEIGDSYTSKFNAVLEQVENYAETTQKNTDTVIQIYDDIENTYLPQILTYHSDSKESAQFAAEQAAKAETSATAAKDSAGEAELSASRAEQIAASAGWADFDINESGHLIFTKTDNLETEFVLTENGRLEVTLI